MKETSIRTTDSRKRQILIKILSTFLLLSILVIVVPMNSINVSANTTSYTYDAEAAVAFAASHCANENQLSKDVCNEDWLCAEFVANCLKAGGFIISGYTSTVNAKAQGEYMQQYETKMSGNITGQPIHDNDFVLPLKKGDIVYIVYDDTVSASGHVLLCSGEKDSNGNLLFYAHNNRKTKETYTITGKYLDAATEMYAIILEDTSSTNESIDSPYSAQAFVDAALAKVDTSFANGYCLRFVAQVFQSTYGGSYISSCCAYKHGNTYIDNNSRNDIPLGACVFFGGSSKTCSTCANKCGHIGIYVGDGYIVHGWGGKIVKTTIDYVINNNYPYRGWGWQANIELDNTDIVISTNPDNYPELDRDLVYTSGTTAKTGNDVKWLQCILLHLGYSIDVDGSYGPASRDTVKKFQSDYGLTVDGIAGPNTRAKLKEIWASKGHAWNSGTIVTAATHTSTGLKTYKCQYCEETKDETIAKLSAHTYGEWQNYSSTQHKRTCACGTSETTNHTWNSGTVTKAATCTAAGVKTYTCTGCNATKTEAIAAKGHSYGSWSNYNSTQHKKTCSCDDVQYANHTWNSGTVTKAATHTEQGVKIYTCTGCEATKTESIAKLSNHTYGSWQNYNTTQHKRTCTCGEYELENHTWNSGTVTKVATHTEQGIKIYTCTGCEATKTENIPTISEHSYGEWTKYDNNQHKRTCTCGYYELSDHDWDEGVIIENPSCVVTGLIIYTCGTCDERKEISIDCIDHNYTEYHSDPSCTEQGYTTYICDCGYTYIDNYVDALGHNYISNVTNPTCTLQGYITYTCHCGDTYIDNYVNALGHDLSYYEGKEPTEIDDGWKSYEACSRCDYTTFEKVPALEMDNIGDESQDTIDLNSIMEMIWSTIIYLLNLIMQLLAYK